ncbi:MAG: ATP-binding cassette domain-containing protein [Firmicutes bacterium]|nr:ATP-binding cassette domain-containing protein [Bacillota bacterium]
MLGEQRLKQKMGAEKSAKDPSRQQKEQVLHFEQLHVQLRGRRVLNGVDGQLCSKQLVALIGRNGAGKSTLLRTLIAFYTPTLGSVWVGERLLASLPAVQRARFVAYVPQEPPRPLAMRVVDSLNAAARKTAPANEVSARVAQAAGQTGILPLLDRACTSLSGGEWRLVSIARALAQAPRFLLLDEPTAGLDPMNRYEFWRLARRLAGNGCGLLIATHDLEEGFSFANSLWLLHEGRFLLMAPSTSPDWPNALQRAFSLPLSPFHVDGWASIHVDLRSRADKAPASRAFLQMPIP